MPTNCGVGTRSPTCTTVELGTASGVALLQPKWGPQVPNLLCYLGLGWVGLDLSIDIKCFNHLATQSQTDIDTQSQTDIDTQSQT